MKQAETAIDKNNPKNEKPTTMGTWILLDMVAAIEANEMSRFILLWKFYESLPGVTVVVVVLVVDLVTKKEREFCFLLSFENILDWFIYEI